MRCITCVIVLLVVASAYPFFLAPTTSAKKAPDLVAKLSDRSSAVIDCWPMRQVSSWTIPSLPTGCRVDVCVRTIEKNLPKGGSELIPIKPKLPPEGSGVDSHSGWMLVGDKPSELKVISQVVDLQELALSEESRKQPIRLLVQLKMGGNTVVISGVNAVLKGEKIVGFVELEGTWEKNELHLLSLYTQSNDKLYSHHLIAQKRHTD